MTIGSPRAAHPAQTTPPFHTGWFDKAAGGLLHSEAACPWLSHWSLEEKRWMHVTNQAEHQAALALSPTWPHTNRPAAAGPAPAAKTRPPAAAATPLTITLDMAAGSRIDMRQLPQGASVGLEASDQDSLLLHLTLPPGAKLSFGPGAATASHAAGAASPPHFQPPRPPTPAVFGESVSTRHRVPLCIPSTGHADCGGSNAQHGAQHG